MMTFEELDKLPEIWNDTELGLEVLNKMAFTEVSVEQSDYSIMTATTYINSDGTIAKKVYSDGMTEYYYTC
jgi:hypothetical protein